MQEVQEVIKSAGDAGIAKMCRCCWCCYAITKKGRISATSHHPNTSSGHHKHDSNNREQSNHAYYQIFSHHQNTSSGHLPATHASCTSAVCQHSNQAKLSFYSHPNDSTVSVDGYHWPLWIQSLQVLLATIDYQLFECRLV